VTLLFAADMTDGGDVDQYDDVVATVNLLALVRGLP